MSDDLYERDILVWSERQADLLRRVARGERVNDVDWDHVVEEIEDVGLNYLHSVQSYLRLMLVHLLKVRGWPDSPSAVHWRGEIGTFQADAVQRFTPSMRQRIDLAKIYQKVRASQLGLRYDEIDGRAGPAECPVSLDELLTLDRAELEARFTAADAPD